MKRIILIVITTSVFLIANAQENNIEPTGNIGIGTTSPNTDLEISPNNHRPQIWLNARGTGDSLNTDFFFGDNGNKKWSLTHRPNDQNSDFVIWRNNDGWKKSLSINYSSGRIGIGTTIPSKLLDVNGDVRIGNLNSRQYLKISSLQWPEIRFETPTSNEKIRIGIAHADTNNYGVSEGDFYVYSATVDKMPLVVNKNGNISLVNKSGNVGIGTTNPTSNLEIKTDLPTTGLYEVQKWTNTHHDEYNLSLKTNWDAHGINHSFVQKYSGTDYNSLSFFRGNVGIGTTNPDMKLTVNGNIHAKEIKVDLNIPAPDYVFEEDYNLKSIEEVENFIEENGHLPEIPSAEEFEQNGVMQVEMDMNLLKKIEELTLYTIQQEKKITALESLNEKLLELQLRLEQVEAKK